MYKLFLCLRYLRRRRIAFFAVIAVCLCVAMVLIVVSVMGGFLQMVKDRSRGMLGDLIVENGTLQGFPYYQEFIDHISEELPDQVHKATPVIITYGVLRFPADQITKAIQIVGIRLEETYQVNDFRKGLFYEKYYPQSTTFTPQKQPAYGYDENRNFILPPELEAAWQQWSSQATQPERDQGKLDTQLEYQRPGCYRPIPPERLVVDPGPAWLDRELPGVIIGTDLCADRTETGDYERYYPRGEKISLTFVPFSPTGKPITGTGMPSRLFRYADDSRTGIFDIDSMSVYISFDLLQDVVEMEAQQADEESGGGQIPARTTQVQIKLTPGTDPLQARDRLERIWDGIADRHRPEAMRFFRPAVLDRVHVQTWEEKQARFIAAVEKEKYLVTILFGVISVVAVFLVGCIFYMIVQQKTRDIGVVKSVGATSHGVASIFLAYGAAVGIVGGALGSFLGTVFVWYINEFQDLIARISPQARVWSPEVYSFDKIPNAVNGSDVAVIYVIAIVASMLGSVIAAVRASRIWPVEALRASRIWPVEALRYE